MVQEKASDEYATIRRTKGRVEKKFQILSSSVDIDNNQFDVSRKAMNRKYDFEILYSKRNTAFDESSEADEGVLLNDIESDADAQSGSSDSNSKRQTFETFKPRNSIEESGDDDGSDKDLQQSSDCFQSLPYDIIMSPLKSPHYINQLNAMRSKAPSSADSNSLKQFVPYSRPDSPKYGKLHLNRSTSPSVDSLADNSSSNSSTYSSNHQHHHHSSTVFKHTAMSQSLHLPHPQNDENMILINVNSAHSPHHRVNTATVTESNLNYRKSFSHIHNNSHKRRQHDNIDDGVNSNGLLEGNNKNLFNNSLTMTKSLYNPSASTSQLSSHQRFATLAYPKEKYHQQLEMSNKSSSSLNETHLSILNCKIGSQTILRTKPAIPWWDLAIKSKHRQSCPPMQVNKILLSFF